MVDVHVLVATGVYAAGYRAAVHRRSSACRLTGVALATSGTHRGLGEAVGGLCPAPVGRGVTASTQPTRGRFPEGVLVPRSSM